MGEQPLCPDMGSDSPEQPFLTAYNGENPWGGDREIAERRKQRRTGRG